MKAKITKADGYSCAPQGAVVVTFPYGSIVEGKVAEMALSDHAASRMLDLETKVTPPEEQKTRTRKQRK